MSAMPLELEFLKKKVPLRKTPGVLTPSPSQSHMRGLSPVGLPNKKAMSALPEVRVLRRNHWPLRKTAGLLGPWTIARWENSLVSMGEPPGPDKRVAVAVMAWPIRL